jgi:hypothetical protein
MSSKFAVILDLDNKQPVTLWVQDIDWTWFSRQKRFKLLEKFECSNTAAQFVKSFKEKLTAEISSATLA